MKTYEILRTITGKEQYGIVVICPNRRWFNSHTEYVDENQKLIN